MSSLRSAFLLGLKDASPTYPGVISFGLITGVSTKAIGFSSLQAIFMSTFMFSGTAQLASLQLYAEGASLILIWLTVILVNFRYIMYSATLLPFLRKFPLWKRHLMSLLMVDQSFAFGLTRFQENPNMTHKFAYYMGISLPLVCIWSSSSTVGVLLGAQVPTGLSLEFSFPLVFLALTVMTIRNRPMLIAALIGGISAALFANLPNGLGVIIAATLAVSAALLSERWVKA